MATEAKERGEWSSRFGFIVATAGSAVGLANVWAFPYRTGQGGGAAFVVIYLLCIFLICLPFMFAELALGRHLRRNVIGAIRGAEVSRAWVGLGALCLAAGIFILSFYGVVAGWSFGYIFKSLVNNKSTFPQFASNPSLILPLFAAFMAGTVFVVHRGIQSGIERWSKVLMPTLVVLMLGLIVHGLTLPGAGKGLTFFLKPDFSKIDGGVVVTAMGQAFFSLSLGIGGVLTYGSYLSKREDIPKAAIQVALLDTGIALLAGLMIFPALFSFGQQPDEGPALVFIVLPAIFQQLPLGNMIGAGFFLMLTIAALTSTISMLEIPVAYFCDERKWTRRRITWVLGGFIFLLGIPSALSQGSAPSLSALAFFGGKSFLEFMIFLWFDVFPPLGALLFSILIGWLWGVDNAAGELQQGSPGFQKTFLGSSLTRAEVWGFFLRYVCPLAIVLIWINAVWD